MKEQDVLNRKKNLRHLAAVLSVPLVAGCGGFLPDLSADSQPIVVGTTSSPSTLDPAASWDSSWELFRNVYQTLLSYPPGATNPVPDAAESCEFIDATNLNYRCVLRDNLTFTNGNKLDAQAVKHSIDRIKEINVPGGPAGLLGNLQSVRVNDDHEVVFQLKSSDATFPFLLATPAMSIVDPADYPATAVREDGQITGSGPYTLEYYEEGKEARLSGNDHYNGNAELKNDAVTIRYFSHSSTLANSLKNRKIDITYLGLAASDIDALHRGRFGRDISVTESSGVDISYLVFNPNDPWTGKLAVRRAVAHLVDRAAIASGVYKDTVKPLYSMVPAGLTGHTNSYYEEFGDPSADKARNILSEAGIDQPVPLSLWYTSDRYGSGTALEFQELKRQLEASGLFEVTLRSRPWKTYQEGYQNGAFPAFGRGWFPDFPDADNFIAPFVGEQNALGIPYESPKITEILLPQSRRKSNRRDAEVQFQEAQQILARDVRLLPLWQGKQFLAAAKELSGAERALDPASIMMMWELRRDDE
ncbi:peptide-binding protein (plasmid) [Streptomyces cadmiisoli]|uniref:Peptide-binding protein n=1 Tax=Streptomyces cadmiisoli TaxID=2184053 RepID=A0A2Z4JE72_9ACTN|nr:peptide-binding protein [Streptomyces cadmiisoli]